MAAVRRAARAREGGHAKLAALASPDAPRTARIHGTNYAYMVPNHKTTAVRRFGGIISLTAMNATGTVNSGMAAKGTRSTPAPWLTPG